MQDNVKMPVMRNQFDAMAMPDDNIRPQVFVNPAAFRVIDDPEAFCALFAAWSARHTAGAESAERYAC